MRLRVIRSFFLVLAIAILSGGIGYKLGSAQTKLFNSTPVKNADLTLFWTVWNELSDKYVDKTKLDTSKMVYGAISGMVSAVGDPYTVFLPPTQNQQAKEDLNGSFEGIGAELGIKDNRIVVVAPISDSPAQKAGILAGDWIVKVDNQDTASWTLPETVAKIRGTAGTKVALNILHPKADKPVDVTITRGQIILKSVEWKKLGNNIAYIKLNRFGDQTDPQWDQTINEIVASNPAGVILDVRNNPGGYLSGAVYIASEFLRSGVVVKQQDYNNQTQTYSVDRPGKLLSVPMVVLINQGTASASEILAGSLQVAGRAKIVGTQSFGKGSVQEAEDLPNGSGLHVTIAKWLLANDHWINGTGLTPDVKIENDANDPTKDAQLDKALSLFSGNSIQ
ncbi:S41 family peptidase [Patescibacteria group bacterium]|nr:S41 family peptidase [Patescibacteria group bacterium]